MRAILTALSLLGVGLLLAAPPPASSEPSPAEFVYVGMKDRDTPFVDYEGDGMVVESSVRQREQGDPYEIELVVIDIDLSREKYLIGDEIGDRLKTRLFAKVVREGKASFRLRGSLDSRVPTRIQFVQMFRAGGASDETFPELAFEPGRHDVAFDANVVGWLEE